MDEKKLSISQIIAIGGAFMGFVIGSSFASGQECMQYFTSFGVLGLSLIHIYRELFSVPSSSKKFAVDERTILPSGK